MENNEKVQVTYTKAGLIYEISHLKKIRSKIVKDVYSALEEAVAKALSTADSETDVTVKLFEGISIDSNFLDEKEKINNLTGEKIITASKVKPKANITRNYGDKITRLSKSRE